MTTLKTLPNDAGVEDFLNTISNDTRKSDGFALLEIYTKITGETPKMWGSSIIGFGQYHYKSDRSTQEGDWPLVGFSPRKQSMTLYFMPGFANYGELLEDLGKYKTSVGCLYVNKLSDIHMPILEKLIERSYLEMKQKYNEGK